MFHILFIEDQTEIRRNLTSIAKTFNDKMIIHEASNIEEAKSILKKNKIDVFFVDIQLGDDNGLKFAKGLRSLSEYQFTPIVFITGLVDKELEAYQSVQCYHFLFKPFTIEDLKPLFSKLLIDYLKPLELPKVLLEYKTYSQLVPVDEIIFVEYKNRKIHLTTKNTVIEYKHMPLKKFQDKLSGHFIQVHQGFLVNRLYIQRVDLLENIIELDFTKVRVPLGRSFRRNLEEVYHEFL
ncbi:MAG: response regulator transcription factor [Clostridia bacterium]|nr:response regulator transcription factor [Clostridia bacterium]